FAVAFGWGCLVSPGPGRAARATCGFFPLLGGGKSFSCPLCVGAGVVVGDPYDGVIGDVGWWAAAVPVLGWRVPGGGDEHGVVVVGDRVGIDPVFGQPDGLVEWSGQVDAVGDPVHPSSVDRMA